MNQSRFSYRVLTSFFVTFDFLILLVTGVVLYVVPPGKGGELDKLGTDGLVEGSVDVGAHTLGTALSAGFHLPSDLQLETVQTLFLSQTPGSSPP